MQRVLYFSIGNSNYLNVWTVTEQAQNLLRVENERLNSTCRILVTVKPLWEQNGTLFQNLLRKYFKSLDRM